MAKKDEKDNDLLNNPPEMVKARVLVDGAFGAVNSVVEVASDVAKQSDELDSSPEAVAYAESLQNADT